MQPFSLIRLFKTLHGWIGVILLPWVVIAGLTGIYMNHSKAILRMLPDGSYNERLFDSWQPKRAMDLDAAMALARSVAPDTTFRLDRKRTTYHGRDAFTLTSRETTVIVTKASGHYWVKTAFFRRTYAPDGTRLDTKFYWGALFSRLHEFGFVDNRFGRWITDILGGMFVVFGVTGLTLFLSPRLRRSKNRRAARQRAGTAQS